ncbi:hypothetical protein CR513_45882, partial [Mucuna pruriens]
MENRGYAVNRPPLFKGQNYDYWKQRMITFFMLVILIWDVVEHGDYISFQDDGTDLPRSLWNETQKMRLPRIHPPEPLKLRDPLMKPQKMKEKAKKKKPIFGKKKSLMATWEDLDLHLKKENKKKTYVSWKTLLQKVKKKT